jgi:VPDSG-CTERM motif
MRTTLTSTIKLAFLCTALAGAVFTFSNNASAVTIRNPAASSGYGDRSTYVNHLSGMAIRSNERANLQYFRADNSPSQAMWADRMNVATASSFRENISVPLPGGGPGGVGGSVPDGGITAMLLGAALGVLGMARRYLKA